MTNDGLVTEPGASLMDDRPIPEFEECGNCGAAARESVTWNRTGGWTCSACGESDYPEAAE